MIDMPQEDWSDYASPTGPDTRQADMVSREKVIELLRLESVTETYPHELIEPELFRRIIEKVRKL